LNGCLVVPVRNVQGDIVQLYGRRIGAATPKNQRHLYFARPLGGAFNGEALKQREIILTESILDALTFVRHGMEAATCTLGTANFTAELFEPVRAAKVESVRLAFDADEAGQAAEAEAAKRLQAVGIECHTVKLPWGMDVNQYALEQGAEALRHAVRSAAWIGKTAVNGHAVEPQKPEVSVTSEDTQPAIQPLSLAANLAAEKETSRRLVGSQRLCTRGALQFRAGLIGPQQEAGVVDHQRQASPPLFFAPADPLIAVAQPTGRGGEEQHAEPSPVRGAHRIPEALADGIRGAKIMMLVEQFRRARYACR